MLRSSSVMNIGGEKKGSGFFESMRSKGWSSKNLSEQIGRDITNQPREKRLSSSMSLNRLNQRHNTKAEQRNDYSSTVAKERYDSENKENGMVPEAKYNPMRSLKKRTSAPSLQKTRNMAPLEKRTPGSRLRKSSTFVNFQDHIGRNHSDVQSTKGSPITPDSIHTSDSLLDLASIKLVDFDNDEDLLLSESLEEDMPGTKVTDSQVIVDYFRKNNVLGEAFKIDKQKSLSDEDKEMDGIRETLNRYDDYISNLRVIQNALFLSVAQKVSKDEKQNYMKGLEDIDYHAAIQDDDYDQTYDYEIYL